jgi:hypothetical protein
VDPVSDAEARSARHRQRKSDVADSSLPTVRYGFVKRTPDVDGDNTPDVILADSLSERAFTMVYVMRGDCGHLVAEADGTVTVKPAAGAWADLVFTADMTRTMSPRAPPTITTRKVTTLRFDGNAYKPVR